MKAGTGVVARTLRTQLPRRPRASSSTAPGARTLRMPEQWPWRDAFDRALRTPRKPDPGSVWYEGELARSGAAADIRQCADSRERHEPSDPTRPGFRQARPDKQITDHCDLLIGRYLGQSVDRGLELDGHEVIRL